MHLCNRNTIFSTSSGIGRSYAEKAKTAGVRRAQTRRTGKSLKTFGKRSIVPTSHCGGWLLLSEVYKLTRQGNLICLSAPTWVRRRTPICQNLETVVSLSDSVLHACRSHLMHLKQGLVNSLCFVFGQSSICTARCSKSIPPKLRLDKEQRKKLRKYIIFLLSTEYVFSFCLRPRLAGKAHLIWDLVQ